MIAAVDNTSAKSLASTSLPAVLLGSQLPDSLWSSDKLFIPKVLEDAHWAVLAANHWTNSDLSPVTTPGAIGGVTSHDAETHFVGRFLNSAARVQFVCLDPHDDDPEIRNMVLDQTAEGTLFLLDLAAGSGAGTLSLLSLIAQLRKSRLLPQLPLNIKIASVDISPKALQLYQDTLDSLRGPLSTIGIEVSLECHVCDLSVTADFNEVLESLLDDAKAKCVRRFLCILSAISGLGEEGLQQIQPSLQLVAATLSHTKRESSWLWVEPQTKKNLLSAVWNAIQMMFKKIPFSLSATGGKVGVKSALPLLPNPVARSFTWREPHKHKDIPAHVVVIGFRNE